jgi:ribonuclease BN (tRNA processing enzyme)
MHDEGPFEVFVAGAGPAYTDRLGATGAAYLVRGGGAAILLDLGQGSFPRLAAEIEPSTLSAVLVSHLHPDHFVDLVALRHYLRYEFHPSRRVAVAGPRGLGDRLDALHDEPGFSAAALDVEGLEPGTRTVGPFVIESRLVTHTDESYGFRVSLARHANGRSPAETPGERGLVYSGDCGRALDLAPLIRPGDTLLVEVSFGPGPVPPGAQHLDGPAVGRLATLTSAGRVLLTHLQMGFDPDATIASVAALYDGDVEFVWPGDRLII